MAVGLLVMVRRRGAAGDLPAALDAAILATGTAVVAGVFVVAPIAADSSLTLLGKLTSTFYPIADVLLLAILVRFWTTPSARTTSFRLLICALGFIFVGDVYYTATHHRDRRRLVRARERRRLVRRLRADRRRRLDSLGARPGGTRCPGIEDARRPHRDCWCSPRACCCPPSPCSRRSGRRADGLAGRRDGLGPALPAGADPDGGAAQRGPCPGGAAGGAGPLRRAHGHAQPPHLGLRAVPGVPGRPRQRPAADARGDRPRPLQGLQRHPRPPGGRPVAQGGDRCVDRAPRAWRGAGPGRRGGVRAAAARS